MEERSNLLSRTFLWMFLGLLGTGIVAWYCYSTDAFITLASEGTLGIIVIVELAVVIIFSLLFRKLSPTVVAILYFVYAFVNGVSLSSIFYVYELNSIIQLFLVSALIFGGLSLYGYKTQKDLSSWGTILMGLLIGGLILSIINIFIGNSTFDLLLDWLILAVFFGVTIYDLNQVRMLEQAQELDQEKLHIYCAMQIYLDFINIFIRILSLFGKRRD